MANRYVDFVNGLDANNGAGPDASDSTNKPWKTITKALGASGAASGDVIYLSPAGQFRETVSIAMTPAAETKVIGDYANTQGFKTSGGVKVAPGPVILTGYTTNDKSTPVFAALLTLNGASYITFQNVMFVNGAGTWMVNASTTTSHDIKWLDCAFVLGYTGTTTWMQVATAFGVALNWTIDRCHFLGAGYNSGNGLVFVLTQGTGAEWDANVLIQNSTFLAWPGYCIQVTVTGTGANCGGGVRVRNCTAFGGNAAFFQAGGTVLSATYPCVVSNSFLVQATTAALRSVGNNTLVEDYNVILAGGTPRVNVTAGTHSISAGAYAPLIHFGQERIWNGLQRMIGEPMAGSPLLGFGNDGNQAGYDQRNNPRPAGGASALPAVGALERANTFARQQATVHTGSNAIGITGPGYQDFLVPVDANSTTLSIYCRYDSTYAGTLPQIQVLANGEIGVSAQTVTATSSSLNGWAQVSLGAFTPSATGVITFRVISNDTNGGGKAYFDTFGVA